jgi:hypothetical protein
MAGNQTVLMAARDNSAGRKPASTGGAGTEMSLLAGPLDSAWGCQSALVDKLGVIIIQVHIAI